MQQLIPEGANREVVTIRLPNGAEVNVDREGSLRKWIAGLEDEE
jgi:hypothetical protein